MSYSHIERLWRELIAEEISSLTTDIAGGLAQDMGQYKELTGIIKGMQIALRKLDEVEKEH